jgi:hypothetical protein
LNKSAPEIASKDEEPAQVVIIIIIKGTILLVTTKVKLISRLGESVSVRTFLNGASEASFVTDRVIQQLETETHYGNEKPM